MKEEFVTYNQALALKELGFDEPCLGVWICKIKELHIGLDSLPYNNKNSKLKKVFEGGSNFISSPLKQQVFRWFRDKHNLWFRPDYYDEMREYDYQGSIHQLGRHSSLITLGNCKTVEELEAKCIDELIEMVKNK